MYTRRFFVYSMLCAVVCAVFLFPLHAVSGTDEGSAGPVSSGSAASTGGKITSGDGSASAGSTVYRAFVGENIAGKSALIKNIDVSSQDCVAVCMQALSFVQSNYELFADDAQFSLLACETVQKSLVCLKNDALPYWEKLFSITNDSALQTVILESFASLAAQNASTGANAAALFTRAADLVNSYVQHIVFSQKTDTNEVLLKAVKTLGKIGRASSFSVLFACYTSPDSRLSAAAFDALKNLSTVYQKPVKELIVNGSITEKRLALELVLKNDANSDFFKAEMAAQALSQAVYEAAQKNSADEQLTVLQMTAVRELYRVSWTRSADLMKQVFTLSQNQYEQGLLSKDNFIEIIRAFTRLASTEAGSHLTAYLKTLNRKQEKNSANPPDPQVVLAVVQSLALLGDKVAFDDLLYATYQNYPDIVVSAAKEALSKLKW